MLMNLKTTVRVFVVTVALVVTNNGYSQTTKKSNMTNKETVLTFLNGFNNPAKMSQSLDLLAEDYKFSDPLVSLHSKKEFIELAEEMGKVLTGLEVLNVGDNTDWVTVMYNFKSAIPGAETNMATEWFRLEDGKIVESTLIYDATVWRKVSAAMEEN